ncbi:MAG: hypothetical protein AB1540_16590 [Bdellovibrionota bacterium]
MKLLLIALFTICIGAAYFFTVSIGTVRFFTSLPSQQKTYDLAQSLDPKNQSPDSLNYAFRRIVSSTKKLRPANSAAAQPEVARPPESDSADANIGLDTPIDIYLQTLEKNPQTAISTIRRDLERLSNQNNVAVLKSTLLQAANNIAANYPEKQEEVRELALREMTTTQVRDLSENAREPGSDSNESFSEEENRIIEERFLVTTAHHIFISSTADPQTALSGTIEGVLSQNNQEVRNIVINQFISKYPDLRKDLASRLSGRGIAVDLPTDGSENTEQNQYQ